MWTREKAEHRLDEYAQRTAKKRRARLQQTASTKEAIAQAIAQAVYNEYNRDSGISGSNVHRFHVL